MKMFRDLWGKSSIEESASSFFGDIKQISEYIKIALMKARVNIMPNIGDIKISGVDKNILSTSSTNISVRFTVRFTVSANDSELKGSYSLFVHGEAFDDVFETDRLIDIEYNDDGKLKKILYNINDESVVVR